MEKASRVKKILFLCTGNSARSQMAEGLLKHYGKGKFEVASAGIAPVGVNPNAIAVMKEIGIDISDHTSDQISKDMIDRAELLITLCGDAHENCPVVPGNVEKRHWPLSDPAQVQGSEEEKIKSFQTVRDQLKALIDCLIAE